MPATDQFTTIRADLPEDVHTHLVACQKAVATALGVAAVPSGPVLAEIIRRTAPDALAASYVGRIQARAAADHASQH